MSLTSTPKPTMFYTRFKYGSPAITVDIDEPVMGFLPSPALTSGLAGENTVATGKREVLFGRLEEACGLVLRCEADTLMRLRWMAEDSAFRGNQFQAWVDRFTGSCWMFENNLKDQNGLVLTLSSGSQSYATASTGIGIVLTSTQYLSVASAQSSAGTPTGYDDPFLKDEGVVLIDWKAAFAATDNAEDRFFIDSTPASNCRLSVFKDTSARLTLQVIDSTNTAQLVRGTVAWSVSDRVQIIAAWSSAGALSLWYAVNGGAFTALTTASGAGTGLMATLPSTLAIGAGFSGSNLTLGTYDTVAIFKRAFADPLQLVKWRPWRRNYFPYGEAAQRQFAPVQVNFATPVWDWPIVFRNGKAA